MPLSVLKSSIKNTSDHEKEYTPCWCPFHSLTTIKLISLVSQPTLHTRKDFLVCKVGGNARLKVDSVVN